MFAIRMTKLDGDSELSPDRFSDREKAETYLLHTAWVSLLDDYGHGLGNTLVSRLIVGRGVVNFE